MNATETQPGSSLDPLVSASRDMVAGDWLDIWEALKEVTTCETCEGTGKWMPECYACLSGEPDRCSCISQQPEPCPQCNGSGREFHGSKKAETVYCANAKLRDAGEIGAEQH